MGWRTGHGQGAGRPHIEVMPADELPEGVSADVSPQEDRTVERDDKGRWLPGTRTAQSAGGKATRQQTRLARRMGLSSLPEDSAFKPYKSAAIAFRKFHVSALAKTVGGGHCGPGPSSVVATAAWQLAASRYLFDRAALDGDPALFAQASRLANDSRQNLLAAHELCAKEAQSRKKQQTAHEGLQAALTAGSDDGDDT